MAETSQSSPPENQFRTKVLMIQNLLFGFFIFFENIISGIQLFYIRSNVHVVIRFFFISDFLAESLNANKTSKKKSLVLQYSFALKTSLILRTSIHLTLKIICSRNTAKSRSDLNIFQQTYFCLASEKIFALHRFLMPENCILQGLKLFESKCLYISVYPRKRCFDPET